MNARKQSHKKLVNEYLVNEYKVALGLWSEARALYGPDAPEIAAATAHLEALEAELASLRQTPALAAA